MITIKTANPQGFLDTIYKVFDEKGSSEAEKALPTWDCVNESGKRYFTHNPGDWIGKAWFQAYIPTNTFEEVRVRIVKRQNSMIAHSTYSHYHGRFIAMLFSNFGNTFITITATSRPTPDDDMR